MVFRKLDKPRTRAEMLAMQRERNRRNYQPRPLLPAIKVGDRFGRLTVFEIYESGSGRYRAKAECECGDVVDQRPGYLLRGVVKSCGCLRSECARTARAEGALARRRRYETA